MVPAARLRLFEPLRPVVPADARRSGRGVRGARLALGFSPGTLWSPLLAGTEFIGGILLAIGFLTRPAAIGATIVLLVTVYFHWVVQNQGYAGAEKSVLWAAMAFFFAMHGGGFFSVDRMMREEV